MQFWLRIRKHRLLLCQPRDSVQLFRILISKRRLNSARKCNSCYVRGLWVLTGFVCVWSSAKMLIACSFKTTNSAPEVYEFVSDMAGSLPKHRMWKNVITPRNGLVHSFSTANGSPGICPLSGEAKICFRECQLNVHAEDMGSQTFFPLQRFQKL